MNLHTPRHLSGSYYTLVMLEGRAVDTTNKNKSSPAWQGEWLADVGHHKPIQSSIWEIWACLSVLAVLVAVQRQALEVMSGW